MSKLLYEKETYSILGACFEVYKQMGCGFLEDVYQECLSYELADRNIPFREQEQLILTYKARQLKKRFVPDFICFESVILEIKAVQTIVDQHKTQVLNYLHATKNPVGLLVNFGHYPQVQHVRFVI
jgi:GxxExxY protein